MIFWQKIIPWLDVHLQSLLMILNHLTYMHEQLPWVTCEGRMDAYLQLYGLHIQIHEISTNKKKQ